MAWDKLLISADSHVVEPADLFAKALGDKHGDKVPRFVDEYQGVKGRYYFTGKEHLRLSVLIEGDEAEQDKLTKAGRDPAFRLTCLDEDGIYAEVLYASSTLHTMRAHRRSTRTGLLPGVQRLAGRPQGERELSVRTVGFPLPLWERGRVRGYFALFRRGADVLGLDAVEALGVGVQDRLAVGVGEVFAFANFVEVMQALLGVDLMREIR